MNRANTQATKTALVTGGARRIGAAIVKKLHEARYNVLIHCHSSHQEAQELASALNKIRPQSVHILTQDLTAANAAEKIIQALTQWTERLDLLVNNASIFRRNQCRDLQQPNWDILFHTNVKAPFLLSLAVRPLLAQTAGCIINITDIHSEKPLLDYSIYCQTKAALTMQTKSLAREFAPEIRVNGVAPGAIAWPEQDNSLSHTLKEKIIAQTPLKRHGMPIFIAQAVLSLAENEFITGQIINVDGGRSLAS